MTLRALADTNVLVYAVDPSNPAKQAAARELLRIGRAAGTLALPAQALAEFASVALRKLGRSAAAVYRQVERLEQAYPVLPLTPQVVLEAVRGVRDHQLAYYDAQIWAVARLTQLAVVLSEDLAPGSRLEGIAFVNPFEPEFDPLAHL